MRNASPRVSEPRRVGVFLFWDADGEVSEYVRVSLQSFRPHFERLIVVVNGEVDLEGQQLLASVSDDVWYRENSGFDVGGYKYGIERLGFEYIREFDELTLFNYTFYAPIHPIGPMFDRMSSLDIDFWGISDYKDPKFHFVQSYFLSISNRLLKSDQFERYWRDMPPIRSIDDSIEHHEKAFTRVFQSLGYKWSVAYPTLEGQSGNVTIAAPAHQLTQGCPILKYRAFTFPAENLINRHGELPSKTLDFVARETDYDISLIQRHISRVSSPLKTAANLGTVTVASTGVNVEAPRMGPVSVYLNVTSTATIAEYVPYLTRLKNAGRVRLYLTATADVIDDPLRSLFGVRGFKRRNVEDKISNWQALFSWVDQGNIAPGDLVLVLGEFEVSREINAWRTNRIAFYVENLLGGGGILQAVLEAFDNPVVDMVTSPPSPYLEGVREHHWNKRGAAARAMASELGLGSQAIDPSPLHVPQALFWMRGSTVSWLGEWYRIASTKSAATDCGDVFNLLVPAILGRKERLTWRVITSANAREALAVTEWSAPVAMTNRAAAQRVAEKALSVVKQEKEDLEVRFREVNAKLKKARADQREADVFQTAARLAIKENRELRRALIESDESLANMRRELSVRWARRGWWPALKRGAVQVKRTIRRRFKRSAPRVDLETKYD